jgi:hypothetical protein
MEVSQESTTVLRWIFYSHRWTWVCGEQQGGVEFDANREVNMGAREEAGSVVRRDGYGDERFSPKRSHGEHAR